MSIERASRRFRPLESRRRPGLRTGGPCGHELGL